jgi:hypothetical protein|tara:strand:+ start:1190 stop:1348 length:159 start_codon:yes stop_codon:yes gene_type:complete
MSNKSKQQIEIANKKAADKETAIMSIIFFIGATAFTAAIVSALFDFKIVIQF